MKRKAQVWTADFVIGLSLFLVVATASIALIINTNPGDNYQYLYKDTIHLTSQLMSTGHPENWNTTSVVIPGLLENKTRLSTSKLEEFKGISYDRTKNLLQTRHEYFFHFKNETGIINMSQCNYGYNVETDENCNPLLESLEYDNLVRIERILIHNSQLTKMVVYSWN